MSLFLFISLLCIYQCIAKPTFELKDNRFVVKSKILTFLFSFWFLSSHQVNGVPTNVKGGVFYYFQVPRSHWYKKKNEKMFLKTLNLLPHSSLFITHFFFILFQVWSFASFKIDGFKHFTNRHSVDLARTSQRHLWFHRPLRFNRLFSFGSKIRIHDKHSTGPVRVCASWFRRVSR